MRLPVIEKIEGKEAAPGFIRGFPAVVRKRDGVIPLEPVTGKFVVVFESEEEALEYIISRYINPVTRREQVRFLLDYLRLKNLSFDELLEKSRKRKNTDCNFNYRALKRLEPFFHLDSGILEAFVRGDITTSVARELARFPVSRQIELFPAILRMKSGEALDYLKRLRRTELENSMKTVVRSVESYGKNEKD